VVDGGTFSWYSPTGHLIYARGAALLAAPFDVSQVAVTAPPVEVIDGVCMDPYSGMAQFAISPSGTLVYVPGKVLRERRRLLWVDHKAVSQPISGERRPFRHPRLSPTRERLAVTLEAAQADLWVLDLQDGGQARPFLRTDYYESKAVFSPDGRWLAYVSSDSGRREVYVRAYPGPGGKCQVSTDGGDDPAWAPTGREVFYRSGDKMLAVLLQAEPVLTAGRPTLLFELAAERSRLDLPNYDVSADGQRFVMIVGDSEPPPTELRVALNWFEELKRRVPVN